MDKKKIASVIATAAAVAFVTAPFTSTVAQAAHKVKCYGVNKCKGHSQCKTASNSCKGQNSCKGKGFIKTTEKHCKKMHGTTEEPTAEATPSTENTTTTN